MRFLLFALLAIVSIAPWALAREITDATQTRVTVADHPKRIVTLIPSLGELAADVAGNDLSILVGVSEFTDYPPALKKLPKVGSFQRIHLEAIAARHPDLVLASLDGNSKDQISHLRELKIPVVVVATDTFARVKESMLLVGLAMGLPAEGERMARQFERGLERISKRAKERTQGRKPKRVLLQVGSSPLIVAGKKSFLNDAIEAIGAINIYGDLPGTYPRPALEDAIARDPDEIVILALSLSENTIQGMIREWTRFPKLQAVKNQRLHVLRDDSVGRPSLRLLEGLDLLEKAVHSP